MFNVKENKDGKYEINISKRDRKIRIKTRKVKENNRYWIEEFWVEKEVMEKLLQKLENEGKIVQKFDIEITLESYVMMDKHFSNEEYWMEWKSINENWKNFKWISMKNKEKYKEILRKNKKKIETDEERILQEILLWVFDLEVWDLKGNEYRWMKHI